MGNVDHQGTREIFNNTKKNSGKSLNQQKIYKKYRNLHYRLIQKAKVKYYVVKRTFIADMREEANAVSELERFGWTITNSK